MKQRTRFWSTGKRKVYGVVLCCLLLFLSGCVSLFSGTGSNGGPSTSPPVTVTYLTTMPDPSPTALSESQFAAALVQNMSLDQKLGQMVICPSFWSSDMFCTSAAANWLSERAVGEGSGMVVS